MTTADDDQFDRMLRPPAPLPSGRPVLTVVPPAPSVVLHLTRDETYRLLRGQTVVAQAGTELVEILPWVQP